MAKMSMAEAVKRQNEIHANLKREIEKGLQRDAREWESLINTATVYLLTKADYDWNEPMGVFVSAEAARIAVAAEYNVEWTGPDAEDIEYPTIDRAKSPVSNYAVFLIREMEMGKLASV